MTVKGYLDEVLLGMAQVAIVIEIATRDRSLK